MLDRVTSIEVFLAVARHGSFVAGAEETGLSRAMVSKHIKSLESQLGVRLFNRNTRAISLTEEGAAYRQRIVPVMEALADAQSSVSRLAQDASGTLTVAAPTSFGAFQLAPIVAQFMTKFPAIRVQLLLLDRDVSLIDEGVDAAVRIKDLADSSLIARRVAQVDMLTCAHPDYLNTNGRPETPSDLSRHNCLVFAEIVQREFGEWDYYDAGRAQTVRVAGDLVSNAGDALRMAALAARGVVRLPSYMVQADIEAGRLSTLLKKYAPPQRPVYVVYPHREHLPSKVSAFVEFLIESFTA